MRDNKIHSWKSESTNDKQEENRIGNNMKCYKYELLFNVHNEVSEEKPNELKYKLDIELCKCFGLTELIETEV